MFGFRSSNRPRGEAAVAMPGGSREFDAVETPLVPCNNLRAHWEIGADGKLEMRWDLVEPKAVTQLRARPFLPPHGPARRSA
jgi:hypothetical protein